MYKLCLSLMIAVAVPSIATAGGGNSKKNGALQFCNVTDVRGPAINAFVIVDPSDALLAQLQAGNFANFAAQGGRVLTPGEKFTFQNLHSGRHRWATALSNAAVPGPNDFAGVAHVEIKGGKTVTVNLQNP